MSCSVPPNGYNYNNNCKPSIAPVSLKSSSSEAQQTQSFGYSYIGTGKSRHWSMEPTQIYGGKAISNKYVLSFLQKVSKVSEDLPVIVLIARFITQKNIVTLLSSSEIVYDKGYVGGTV